MKRGRPTKIVVGDEIAYSISAVARHYRMTIDTLRARMREGRFPEHGDLIYAAARYWRRSTLQRHNVRAPRAKLTYLVCEPFPQPEHTPIVTEPDA